MHACGCSRRQPGWAELSRRQRLIALWLLLSLLSCRGSQDVRPQIMSIERSPMNGIRSSRTT